MHYDEQREARSTQYDVSNEQASEILAIASTYQMKEKLNHQHNRG